MIAYAAAASCLAAVVVVLVIRFIASYEGKFMANVYRKLVGPRRLSTAEVPTRREQGTVVGSTAAIALVIPWALETFAGVEMPPDVAMAVGVLAGAIANHITRRALT